MEHTSEFLSRMFAAYVPCLAMHKKDGPYAIQGVSIMEGMALFEWDDDSDWWNITDEVKLLLKPLSAISDEHAIEVAKILEVIGEGCRETDFLYWGKYAVNVYLLSTNRTSIIKTPEVFDFLRSKSYDCGFQHIPSLIDAGLALNSKS